MAKSETPNSPPRDDWARQLRHIANALEEMHPDLEGGEQLEKSAEQARRHARQLRTLAREILGARKKTKGVYLELFHGRRSLDQDMDDWGLEGPILGPFDWVHTTYGSEIKLGSDWDQHDKPRVLSVVGD